MTDKAATTKKKGFRKVGSTPDSGSLGVLTQPPAPKDSNSK